ncbi:MAG: methyl-accepting chemotaxis protein [Halanaerobiales bacterium]
MNLKLQSKILISFIIIFLLFSIAIYFTVSSQVTKLANTLIGNKLSADFNLGYQILEERYPGEWQIIDGQLYKGEHLINNDYELVDVIKEETGSLATIFMKDIRVTTNVLNEDNTRAVGTRVSDQVAETVLRNGDEYTGEAVVVGETFLARYSPIRNADGDIIGIWFVGVEKETAQNQISLINGYISIICIVLLVISIVIAYFISRSISLPILNAAEDLHQGAENVASAANQLSSSSQQLAEGSTEQASSLEETSSTLEESASMVKQNTANTQEAAILAREAREIAEEGNHKMQEMMNSMIDLKDSSDEVARIIKVIDDIAFQTNILALNAAVEAARAGDAGMGFAVVAEEVRTLAQRSAKAAKDTDEIIEKNINLAKLGMSFSSEVDQSLQKINDSTKKVNNLLDEIAAASKEQSQGVEQINQAVSQMDQVVQSNASAAEESASASEELSSQAQSMTEVVNELIELVKKGKNNKSVNIKSFFKEGVN